MDALAHVVRAFEDPSIPHVGPIDPLRDIRNVEFDLMVSDLGQIEKRLERLEKDLKKMRSAELEKEFDLLKRAKAHLESEHPLREMEMTPEDKKRLRGFMFDVGLSDQLVAPASLARMDSALTNAGVRHTYETYDGDHTNRIAARLATRRCPLTVACPAARSVASTA